MIPDRCRPWLEAALRQGDGGHALEDIEAGIRTGHYTLVEGERTAVVLEIIHRPRRKVLSVFLAGGEAGAALPELVRNLPWLDAVAQGIGAELELRGRRGWVRALKPHGWREAHTTLVKENP